MDLGARELETCRRKTDLKRALDMLEPTAKATRRMRLPWLRWRTRTRCPHTWIPRWGNAHALAEHHASPRPHRSKFMVEVTSLFLRLPRAWRLRLVPRPIEVRPNRPLPLRVDGRQVSSGGLSRTFNLALYLEEWRMKKGRLPLPPSDGSLGLVARQMGLQALFEDPLDVRLVNPPMELFTRGVQ